MIFDAALVAVYNQRNAHASRFKIESCVEHVLEHRQFFASCLGHQGIARLMMTSRVLLRGLDHAIVWNECNQKTPMALLARYFARAVLYGNKGAVQRLLRHPMSSKLLRTDAFQKFVPVTYKRPHIMHLTVCSGNLDIMNMLAETAGECMAVLRDSNDETCIHLAARLPGSSLRVLLKNMPDKPSLKISNKRGETPLNLAIICRNPQNVKALIDYDIFSASHVNPSGKGAPVHVAAWAGHTECFKLVYAATFPTLRFSQCSEGYTPLMIGCVRDDTELVHFILQEAKKEPEFNAYICSTSSLGQTCLHLCILNANASMVQDILENCPQALLRIENVSGMDALDMARLLHLHTIAAMIEHKASAS